MMTSSKFKIQSSKLLLIAILVLGFGIRLFNVSTNPPGLTWDEASLGYNAYSILKTGRDEYGSFWPLTLKSFGDYKPAFYAYLDIPFVALFGLNELAVRIPSVLAGVVFIFFVYLLLNELFKRQGLSLLGALMAAISPLSIQFSRAAFESNLALLLNTMGLYFFIKGFKSSYFYFFSAGCFVLSLLTYQSSKIFIPMLVLGSYLIFKERIKHSSWFYGGVAILAGVVILLTTTIIFFGQTDRLQTTNFFAYQRSEQQIDQISKEDGLNQANLQFQILHGEWFAYTRGLFERFLIYFSPRMLFIDGDYSGRHKVPDLGVLSFSSIILVVLGLFFLMKNDSKGSKLILFWLLIAPIPAVLSRDLINMVRALNMALPLVVIEGAGLYLILSYIRKFSFYYLGYLLVFGIILLNFSIYVDRLLIHAPIEYSQYFLYGHKQVFEKIGDRDLSKYNKVVFSDKYGQPYIFYLFYNKYDPSKFQKQAILDKQSIDVGTIRRIDNIEFRSIYWPLDRGEKNSLFIGTLEELPDQDVLPFKEFKEIGKINFLDKLVAFRIVETER